MCTIPQIKRLTLGLTYQCNSRCTHCNTWQTWKSPLRSGNLSIDEYKDLLTSKVCGSLEEVSLTGGEPFLYRSIGDLIRLLIAIHPHINLSINTNGTNQKALTSILQIEDIKTFKEIQIVVSVDGIGVVHDNIRGLNGSFDKNVNLIKYIRRYFPWVTLSISFTAYPTNFRHLTDVLELSNQLDVGFTARMANNSFFYDNQHGFVDWSQADLQEVNEKFKVVANHLAIRYNRPNSSHVIFLRRAVVGWLEKQRHYECFSGKDSLYIDPRGDVFPCIMLHKVLGNVAKDSLEDILLSNASIATQHHIAERRCCCWTECETMKSIIRQKELFISWCNSES